MLANPTRSVDDLPDVALGQDGGFDFRRAGQTLRRRLPPMALVLLAVLAATAIVTLLQKPVYQAEATLVSNPPPSAGGSALALSGVTTLLGPMGGGSAGGVSQQAELLRHPALVTKAARELGIKGGLDELLARVHPEADIATNIIALKADGSDPGEAADFANRLADLHLEHTRALAQEQSREASKFLAQEMDRVRSQLTTSEESLRDYKLSEHLSDLTAQAQSTIEMASTVATDIVACRTAEADAQQKVDYFRRELREQSHTYIASSTIARNPSVQQFEAALNDLELRRANQLAVHGPQHSELVRLEAQIEEAKKALSEAVSTVVESRVEAPNPRYQESLAALATADAEARAARARRTALEGVESDLTQQMSDWPVKEVEVGRLQRDLTATAEIYVMLVKQYQQAKINEATGTPNVQIVWPATEPLRPVKPSWPINLVIGFVVGLLLAVLAAAIAENRDQRLHTEDDLRGLVNLPTVGRAPCSAIAPGAAGPAQDDRFRALRIQLRLVNGEGPPQLIQSTNPEPGADAAVVALGLAKAFATGGQRTLLVDCHLRENGRADRPYDAWLGEGARSGLSAVLQGQAEAASCIVAAPLPGLSLLPGGRPVENPADLLDSPKGKAVFESLRGGFDAIVLDAPAVVGRPEAVVLAALADCTLLVIDTHRVRRGAVRRSVEYLAATGKPILAFVLNRVDDQAAG